MEGKTEEEMKEETDVEILDQIGWPMMSSRIKNNIVHHRLRFIDANYLFYLP